MLFTDDVAVTRRFVNILKFKKPGQPNLINLANFSNNGGVAVM